MTDCRAVIRRRRHVGRGRVPRRRRRGRILTNDDDVLLAETHAEVIGCADSHRLRVSV